MSSGSRAMPCPCSSLGNLRLVAATALLRSRLRIGFAAPNRRLRPLQFFVAGAGGTALKVVHDFAVRAQTRIGVLAPEGTVVAWLDRGVRQAVGKHAFPAEFLATAQAGFAQVQIGRAHV